MDVFGTVLPHSDFGDPECCGCLAGVLCDDHAEITCNECGNVVRTVPAQDLQRRIDDMELSLDIATAKCPNCEAVHLAPGFSKLMAFVCRECGEAVKLE